MIACLDQMDPVLGLPGVWQDLPWVSRERTTPASPSRATRQIILDELDDLPPVALSDSALWAQHDCWDL